MKVHYREAPEYSVQNGMLMNNPRVCCGTSEQGIKKTNKAWEVTCKACMKSERFRNYAKILLSELNTVKLQ